MSSFDELEMLGLRSRVQANAIAAGDVVIQLADGEIEREGQQLRWRTAGVYRLDGERVAEVWLVPLELAVFDAIWRALGGPSA